MIGEFLSNYMFGMRVVTSEYAGDRVVWWRERSLKERLFTFPWRPFKKLEKTTRWIPNGNFIIDKIDNVMYCHPADYYDLQQQLMETKLND